MPPIKHTALFDFERYEAAIKEIKLSTVEFGKATDDVLKRLKASQGDLTKELKDYKAVLQALNVNQQGASDTLRTYGKQVDELVLAQRSLVSSEKALQAIQDLSTASLAEMEKGLKALKNQYAQLKPGQADFAQKEQEIKDKISQVIPLINAQNAALKGSKQSITYAEGSYKAMQAQLGALRTQLREMPGAFNASTGAINKNNKEAVALNKEIQRLDGTLKNADKSMGLFFRNVGNYPFSKIAGGFKSIVANIGLMIGIGSAFEALSFITENNKQFDALNQSIRLVSGSSVEYAKNQAFLRKTSDDLGLEIMGLAGGFKSFFAASTQAGISADSTREIFLSASKAAANLRLSQDDVNGVMLAFGQIASKGTVQAEELRGQIGERIPGAFNIAAKAMGVTTMQLNAMLQKGEVVSADFLPKFARELEKTFGKTDRVDGLTASVNRFQNSLKTATQDENLSRFLSDVVEVGTDFIKFLTGAEDASEAMGTQLRKEQIELNGLASGLMAASNNQEVRNQIIEQIRAKYPEFLGFLSSEAASNDEIARALKVVNGLYTTKIKLAGFAAVSDKTQAAAIKSQADLAEAATNNNLNVALKGAGRLEEFYAASQERQAKIAQEVAASIRKSMGVQTFGATDSRVKALDAFAIAAEKNLKTQAEANRVLASIEQQKSGELSKQSKELTAIQDKIKGINVDLKGTKDEKRTKELQSQLALLTAQEQSLKDILGFKTLSFETTGAGKAGQTDKQIEAARKKAEAQAKRDERAVEQANRQRQETLEKAAQVELKRNELKLAQELETHAEFEENKYIITVDYLNKAIAIEQQLGPKADTSRIDEYKKKIIDAEIELAKEIKKMREKGRVADPIDLTPAINTSAPIDDRESRYKAAIQAEEDYYKLVSNGRDNNLKDEVEHLQRLKAIKLQYAKDTGDEETKLKQIAADKQKEIDRETREVLIQAGQEAVAAFQSFLSATSENRITELEAQKERELEAAGSNTAARLLIEKDFNDKIRKEKVKQAQQERAFAVFQIAINTAQAIGRVLAEVPKFDFGISTAALIAAYSALGAIQIAAVLSKPLPKFKTGTRNAPQGPALVAEEGYELIEKDGKMSVAAKPSIVELKGGEKIYTHSESKRIIERSFKTHEIKAITETGHLHDRLSGRIRESSQAAQVAGGINKADLREVMSETLAKQQHNHLYWDERGYHKEIHRKNEIIKYQNSRYSS